MSGTNTPVTTTPTPLSAVENVLKSPKSWAGWAGLVGSVALYAEGFAGQSTGSILEGVGMTVVSILSVVLPAITAKK